MRWFARGKLWPSREAEHEDFQRRKRHADAPFAKAPAGGERRNADWRPGGTHKDPRDRFKKKNRPERAWSEGEGEDRRSRPSPPRDRPWQGRKPGGPPRDRPWSGKPRVEGQGPGNRKPEAEVRRSEAGRRESKTAVADGRMAIEWENKSATGREDQRPWSNKPPAVVLTAIVRGRRPQAAATSRGRTRSRGCARGIGPGATSPAEPAAGPAAGRSAVEPEAPAVLNAKSARGAKPPPQSKEGGDRSFSPKRRGPRKRHDDEPPDE